MSDPADEDGPDRTASGSSDSDAGSETDGVGSAADEPNPDADRPDPATETVDSDAGDGETVDSDAESAAADDADGSQLTPSDDDSRSSVPDDRFPYDPVRSDEAESSSDDDGSAVDDERAAADADDASDDANDASGGEYGVPEDPTDVPATEPVIPEGSTPTDGGYAKGEGPGETISEGEAISEGETIGEGDDDEGLLGEAPDSDEEMPLADHIEEMMRRLGIVFLVGGITTLVVFGVGQAVETVPSAIEMINYLWNNNIPGAPELQDRRPRLYGPLELLLTELKVAGLAGVVLGLPVFVYQTYLFMRPGLYPTERRYYLAAVPTSLVLAVIGVTFANFVVLPSIFNYFTTYTEASGTIVAFGLTETFNLILLLMGYMAVVFQIPLFMMLAIMMGLTSRQWMENRRLLFWGAFLGLAFLVSPDPTGMAPIIIAATMVSLFEGTLALLRWTGN